MLAMIDIDHYSREYDNFLSPSMCDTLVSFYHDMLEQNREEIREKSGCKGDCKLCTCERIDLNNFDQFKSHVTYIYNAIIYKLEQYKKDTQIDSVQLPSEYNFEVLRIKKYNAGVGEHKKHVDVVNHATAKRFLQFCVYLNDDFEQGGTHFHLSGRTIVPKKGKLFIFPPLWPWLHSGQMPVGNDKYFLATYMTYKD